MTYYDDIYPVSRITAGAIGEIGRRVFILQAKVAGEIVSWVIEKDQAVALSRSIPRLLDDVRKEFPELAEPVIAAQPNLSLSEPLDPEFRVGGIGLGYDRVHDLVVLTLQDVAGEEDEAAVESPANGDAIQVYTTRGQALLLGRQAGDVVAAGRPLCPNCDEPIDDFGHFCLASLKHRQGGDYLQ